MQRRCPRMGGGIGRRPWWHQSGFAQDQIEPVVVFGAAQAFAQPFAFFEMLDVQAGAQCLCGAAGVKSQVWRRGPLVPLTEQLAHQQCLVLA